MINKELKYYIDNKILPQYKKNESGHGMKHVNYCIKRSLKLSNQFRNINLDMVYTIAAFHDIAHHLDKDNHQILSAKIFYENEEMKKFFTDLERKIIKEAIEDHRASLEIEPRSNYGKIISSADRNTDIDTTLRRTHSYTCKHFPNLNLDAMMERAYEHITKKYGEIGYAKTYCLDEEYTKFKEDMNQILSDKEKFKKRYVKANKFRQIEQKAKKFAIEAHEGQVRKSEPEKPMIIHPINAANILRKYNMDSNVIAAAYLHDVVEDTKYTIEDIEKIFGSDIASLVTGATEIDKSLSWEERKEHTIKTIKTKDLRHKAIVCADKISNLEDLLILSIKKGEDAFSSFKRGRDKQKWYYESIYESLIYNEDSNHPMFVRLKELINKIFNEETNNYIKNIIITNEEEYNQVLKLHYKKKEVLKLKSILTKKYPYVIEFTGSPRTGKTSLINNLEDFFKKANFKTHLIEEFTTSKKYKKEIYPTLKDKYKKVVNTEIPKYVLKQLLEGLKTKNDIIIVDRCLLDRLIWIDRLYLKDGMTLKEYEDYKQEYIPIIKEKINTIIALYTDSITSLKRDYQANLSLEKRNFLNEDNINTYNDSLLNIEKLSREENINLKLYDTTNKKERTISIEVANKILDDMREFYITKIKEELKNR